MKAPQSLQIIHSLATLTHVWTIEPSTGK